LLLCGELGRRMAQELIRPTALSSFLKRLKAQHNFFFSKKKLLP
jgi:hypothetical protein